jgi:hypothetical protein
MSGWVIEIENSNKVIEILVGLPFLIEGELFVFIV